MRQPMGIHSAPQGGPRSPSGSSPLGVRGRAAERHPKGHPREGGEGNTELGATPIPTPDADGTHQIGPRPPRRAPMRLTGSSRAPSQNPCRHRHLHRLSSGLKNLTQHHRLRRFKDSRGPIDPIAQGPGAPINAGLTPGATGEGCGDDAIRHDQEGPGAGATQEPAARDRQHRVRGRFRQAVRGDREQLHRLHPGPRAPERGRRAASSASCARRAGCRSCSTPSGWTTGSRWGTAA